MHLVIDTDTARDHAISLFIARRTPWFPLRGITIHNDNVNVIQQVENALNTVEVAGRARDMPVFPYKALLPTEVLSQFQALKAPLGDMLYDLFTFFGRHEPNAGTHGMPIHDVLAGAALIHPEFFAWQRTALAVERHDPLRRGATRPTTSGPLIDAAVDIDVAAFFRWLWQSLAAYR